MVDLLGVLVRLIPTGCPVTVTESLALTGAPPDVPDAVPIFVMVPFTGRVDVQVALAPGASGPQEQTAISSAVFPGVPLLSTMVPDAGYVLPVFVTTYVYVTGVFCPFTTSDLSVDMWSVMDTLT